MLAKHLGALVEFCMRLATNDNVDESVRVHGLTFVVQVAELYDAARPSVNSAPARTNRPRAPTLSCWRTFPGNRRSYSSSRC